MKTKDSKKSNKKSYLEKYPEVPKEKTLETQDQRPSPHFDNINKETVINAEVEVAKDIIGDVTQTERSS